MERCLEQVAAYRGSGLNGKAWAEANGVPLRALSSWCVHAQRWQARLGGVSASAPAPAIGGCLASRVPAVSAATVRIELHAGLDTCRALLARRERAGTCHLAARGRPMIRIEMIWLALGASDLRRGIDMLLAQVLRGLSGGAQAQRADVFANRHADRLKALVYDGVGMWLCTRRLQAGGFAWPRVASRGLAMTPAYSSPRANSLMGSPRACRGNV